MFDERTTELIAIGASITANCQPCLEYHTAKALECGITSEEVWAAVEIGKRVRRGATAKMDRFAAALDGKPMPAGNASDCRADAKEAPTDHARLLDDCETPTLLMQGKPRLVIAANQGARNLFGKDRQQIEGQRGGQVFDCTHSFTPAGCGMDVHCENCAIKTAIVDTFATGVPHNAIATLPTWKAGKSGYHTIQVSAEKAGDLALVRIERYDETGGLPPERAT